MSASIHTLTPELGAEIRGIDLAAPLDDASRDLIYRAFLEHHLVVIRSQAGLSTARVLELSRVFGRDLEPHTFQEFHHPETPLIIVLSNRTEAGGKPKGLADAGTFWHSDVSYQANPAKATLLYAVEVPEDGGDTLFCNLTAAYEALPAAMKARLDGLTAVHDYLHSKRDILVEGKVAAPPPGVHPVVRTHAETGRKAIYINPAYTTHIEGLESAESDALMAEIFDHCLAERFRMTYRWKPGDVVVWDNAATMHSATTKHLDPAKHRTLWRTIISGDTPVR
ncbi:MAG: TauD/TfdA family dioxygenase [Magnetovibrio sp.]|nr:TauD/TfdA family dioxygenase [Magnetovibrio sp.]